MSLRLDAEDARRWLSQAPRYAGCVFAPMSSMCVFLLGNVFVRFHNFMILCVYMFLTTRTCSLL
eukprot:SAG22_NODE_86_length_21440_cov_288.248700_13_plen_64_part_00